MAIGGDIKWSSKQIEILSVIKRKNTDGSYCSIYDIMAQLSYDVKRDSLAHGLRFLLDAELIEKMPTENRGGKAIRPFKITERGSYSV